MRRMRKNVGDRVRKRFRKISFIVVATAVECCGVAFDTTNVSLIQAISTMHVTYGFWCACKRVTQCKEVVSVPVRQVQIPVQVDVQV